MRYVSWVLKLALFLVILSFAVKNTDLVSVRYYLGYEWRGPLVLVLLVFFGLGALVGLLVNVGQVFRQRRAIAALKRDLVAQERVAAEAGSASPRDAA